MHRPGIEYPLGAAEPRCLLFPAFLDAGETAQLRQQLLARGFRAADPHYPPSYRNNLRQVFDDAPLAARLLPRVQAALAAADPAAGLPLAINPHWRSCHYRPGQAFPIHQDGVWHAPDGRASRRTFMVYLDDPASFSGGDTLFYDGPPDRLQPPRVVARVRPPAGSLIVFDHALWHAGETVVSGHKTVLRSELLYAAADADIEPGGHRGYVFCLAAQADGGVLSGGRDGTLRRHRPGGTGDSVVIGRHAQSVLAIAVGPAARIASVGREGALKVHTGDGAAASCQAGAHDGAALCVAWMADGALLTGGADHTLACWSADGRTLRWRQRRHAGWLWDLAVLPDGRVASAGEDGRLLLWCGAKVVAARQFPQPLRSVCALSATTLVVGDAGGWLHRVRCEAAGLLPGPGSVGHSAALRCVRHDPVSGGVLSAAEDGRLLAWSAGLEEHSVVARRANFATALLRTTNGAWVSAGYAGGVRWHGPG